MATIFGRFSNDFPLNEWTIFVRVATSFLNIFAVLILLKFFKKFVQGMSQSCRVAARERERYEFVFRRLWTFRSTWQRRPIDWTLVKRPITWVKVAPSLIELFFVSAFVPFPRQFFFFLPTISIRFHSFAVFYANFMQMGCGEMSEIFVWKIRFRLEFDFNSIFLNFWHFLTILTKLILCKFMQIYANEVRKNS